MWEQLFGGSSLAGKAAETVMDLGSIPLPMENVGLLWVLLLMVVTSGATMKNSGKGRLYRKIISVIEGCHNSGLVALYTAIHRNSGLPGLST